MYYVLQSDGLSPPAESHLEIIVDAGVLLAHPRFLHKQYTVRQHVAVKKILQQVQELLTPIFLHKRQPESRSILPACEIVYEQVPTISAIMQLSVPLAANPDSQQHEASTMAESAAATTHQGSDPVQLVQQPVHISLERELGAGRSPLVKALVSECGVRCHMPCDRYLICPAVQNMQIMVRCCCFQPTWAHILLGASAVVC